MLYGSETFFMTVRKKKNSFVKLNKFPQLCFLAEFFFPQILRRHLCEVTKKRQSIVSQHKSDIHLIDSLGEDYEISSTIEGSKQNYYCYM